MSLERHRQGDESAPGALDDRRRPAIKVTREIPLVWILTVVGSIAGQSVMLWSAQREQGQQLHQLTESVRGMTADVKPVTIKVTEHEVRMSDHERRLQSLEVRQGR